MGLTKVISLFLSHSPQSRGMGSVMPGLFFAMDECILKCACLSIFQRMVPLSNLLPFDEAIFVNYLTFETHSAFFFLVEHIVVMQQNQLREVINRIRVLSCFHSCLELSATFQACKASLPSKQNRYFQLAVFCCSRRSAHPSV